VTSGPPSDHLGRCQKGYQSYDKNNCFDITTSRTTACMGVCLLIASVTCSSLLSTYSVKTRAEPLLARTASAITGEPARNTHQGQGATP
jgi:hypothetical protein